MQHSWLLLAFDFSLKLDNIDESDSFFVIIFISDHLNAYVVHVIWNQVLEGLLSPQLIDDDGPQYFRITSIGHLILEELFLHP